MTTFRCIFRMVEWRCFRHPKQNLHDRHKTVLIARDYQEVINYAFVDADWELDLVNK
jgi:phenylalanyl-tRNA synthetase beta subunit